MMNDSAELPPPLQETVAGSTASAGQAIDQGQGRIFPCAGCGADLEFHIGQQQMKCPYCGYQKEIELDDDEEVAEQDLYAMLDHMRELRDQKDDAHQETGVKEVRCESCSGTVVFVGSLTSSACPYCASPIQLENVHDAVHRVPVDGVLPFLTEKETAKKNLKAWVKSLWFAPNDLNKNVTGTFNGVYLPFWTYDTLTFNKYTGQRGEHYYVTRGTGKNKRRVRKTRWWSASGKFQRFFDDVLVLATKNLSAEMMLKLEPWPLHKCVPFNQEMLAGYLARTYEIELEDGFRVAKKRIDAALDSDVRSRIGGDEQRVHSIDTRYDAITYKHLLLPVWLLAYRYNKKSYQVMINASTGEVQGDRPYSWVKITLAVLGGLLAVGGIVLAMNQ